MKLSSFNITNNLYIPVKRNIENDFEEQYILLRHKENKLYTDEELFQLPDIAQNHPHFNEWRIRNRSSKQLVAKLEMKKNILSILEIGCGNGWLSHRLSRIPGSRVIGLDINLTELQQAARVFNSNSKLKFIYGDIRTGLISDLKFDVIIFAASIQYFPSVPEILDICLQQLYPEGEIHIIDSAFYKPGDVDAAADRTKAYYMRLGFPRMAGYYYHHCITELSSYRYKVLRNPSSIISKLFRNNNPFLWIRIKK